MISESFIVSSPILWLFLSGIAFGAALSRITRRVRTDMDRERAVTRKWVMVSLSLSLGVGFIMVGTFVPGAEKLLRWTNLYVFAAGVGVSFLALRFKKAVGLPFLLVLIAFLIAVVLFVQSLVAFTGETEIARVKVLSADAEGMTLELAPSGEEPAIIQLDGAYFSPVVKVVIFEDYWVFLGGKSWYRFEGMISFRIEEEDGGLRLKQGERDFYFERPPGISERLFRFFERNEKRIPGVKSVQIEIDTKRVEDTSGVKRADEDLEIFSIRVQNDGGVQIVREN
jgi:hypothetical protein